MGRKNLYEDYVEPNLDKIEKWVETLSEADISKKLGISYATFQAYKKQYPALSEVLKNGRQNLVVDLKDSLKKKAKGFYYEETTIREISTGKPGHEKVTKIKDIKKKYSPPDTGAIHLLLKNLDPEWRNDDMATLDLKKEKLQIEKDKNW